MQSIIKYLYKTLDAEAVVMQIFNSPQKGSTIRTIVAEKWR